MEEKGGGKPKPIGEGGETKREKGKENRKFGKKLKKGEEVNFYPGVG